MLPSTAPESVPETAGSILDDPVPPMILKSQAAFHRDLAELCQKYSLKWVAYHGDQRIGIAATQTELYQACLRRGLRRDEFVVRSIEPANTEEEWEASLDV